MTEHGQQFQKAVRAAQIYLFVENHDDAVSCLCLAMKHANRLSSSHRRVTMRALNWTRAARQKSAFGRPGDRTMSREATPAPTPSEMEGRDHG